MPFYVYAYAFGDCLVSSLYTGSTRSARKASSRSTRSLACRRHAATRRLLAPFGLDASDPGFWAKGLGLLDELIGQLEATLPAHA
ncbi:MAG: hypothetical protein U1E17_00975 [Geminicoccaceae bacterium]